MIGRCTQCGKVDSDYTEEERNTPGLLCGKCRALKLELDKDLENAVAYGKTIDTFMDSIFNPKKEKSHEA